MKHVVGQIAVTNLTNSTVTIRANLIPGQSRAIKLLPYKTILVDRDVVYMALEEFRKDKAKGVIWFDEDELNIDTGATETGVQGTTGISIEGITGLQGDTGLPGSTGLQGLGETGLPGVGSPGSTGLQGVTGLPYVPNTTSFLLDDNQVDMIAPGLVFPLNVGGIVITYKISLVSTNDMRVGMIYVASNGISSASMQDNFAETDDIGVSWKASVDVSYIYLKYTTSLKSSQRSMVSEIKII